MKCIVCLTDNNLNTHMKVEVDNEMYEVHLCDEHAETTTMGQVTKKVKEIKDKLKNAVQLAIDLGISIPEITVPKQIGVMPDLDIVSNSDVQVQIQPEIQIPTPTPVSTNENKIIRKATPIKLSSEEEILCDTEIEMQEINVRGGKIEIPKKTRGDAGETQIKIINTSDDRIQQRFKELKNAGDQGQSPGGYNISDCTMCNGTGTHPVLKKDCPKCAGTGMRA